VKNLAIAIIGWTACVFALGLIARVTWLVFMIGWNLI